MSAIAHEQEFELYHYQESLCSQMVRIALAEKGFVWQSHVIALEEVTLEGDNLSDAYLAINPKGQVPTLVHRGRPVYDSYEIIRYLDQHEPAAGARLVPEDRQVEEVMNAWILQSSLRDDVAFGKSLGTAIPMLSSPLIKALINRQPLWHVLKKFQRHPVAFRRLGFCAMRITPTIPAMTLKKSVRTVGRALIDIEKALTESEGPYLLGDFNQADVMMMAHFHRLEDVALGAILDWDALPHIRSYWQELQRRASYQVAVKDWEEENWRWAIREVFGREGMSQIEPLRRAIMAQLD